VARLTCRKDAGGLGVAVAGKHSTATASQKG
jgi:hypothetical protein